MNKGLIVILLILLVIGGGIYLLSNKQNQILPSSPTESITPTKTTSVTDKTSQNTGVNTATTGKADESKNQISLTVTQPTDGQTTSSSSITVKGATTPNADVSVNDVDLKADTQGNFSTTVTLDEGDNVITVVVVDQYGQTSEKDLNVTYNSGQQYN